MVYSMIKRYYPKILVLMLLFFTINRVCAENTGSEEWQEDTITFEDVKDELDRIAEAGSVEEVFQECISSSILTDEMKSVYCKGTTNSSGNQMFELMLDFDPEVRSKEMGKRFYLAFWNSTQTAVNINWNWFDWGISIVTVSAQLIVNILEVIGGVISIIVMFVVNVASGNVIGGVVREVFNQLHNFIFGNTLQATTIVVLLFLAGLVRMLLENAENLRNLRVVLDIFKKSFLTFLFVIFIAIPGRNILYEFDSQLSESVAQLSTSMFSSSEDFDGATTSTTLKAKVFYMLQEQPFMLRHYGVISEELIALRFDISKEEAIKRYEKLLFDPSKATAKNEMKKHGNKSIPHDLPSMMTVFLVSLVMLIHKFLLGFIIFALSLANLCATVFKEFLIGVTFTAIFSFALSRYFSAIKLIANKLSWLMLLSFIPLGISLFMEALISFIQILGNFSFVLVIIADGLILFFLFIAWRNKEKIMETISKFKEPLSGMLNGTYSVGDGFNDMKSKVVESSRKSLKNKGADVTMNEGINISATLDIEKVNKNEELYDEKDYSTQAESLSLEDLADDIELGTEMGTESGIESDTLSNLDSVHAESEELKMDPGEDHITELQEEKSAEWVDIGEIDRIFEGNLDGNISISETEIINSHSKKRKGEFDETSEEETSDFDIKSISLEIEEKVERDDGEDLFVIDEEDR